eukprot:gene30004-39188_t
MENVTLDTAFSNPKNFTLSKRTLELLRNYRKEGTETDRLQRIGNHLRQFDHDATCYERVKALEAKYKVEINVLMRIRDNALVTRPIDILKTMSLGGYKNVLTKRCGSWDGYSDKVWIIPRQFMKDTMHHLVNLTLSATEKFLFNPLPVNSETLLKSVWVHYGVKVSMLDANKLPVVDGRCTKMALNATSQPHFSRVPNIKDCWPSDLKPIVPSSMPASRYKSKTSTSIKKPKSSYPIKQSKSSSSH